VVWRRVAVNHSGQTTKVNEATMGRLYRAGAALLTAVLLGSAQAQSDVSTPPQPTPPPPSAEPATDPAPASAAPSTLSTTPSKFEGAVGLVVDYKPAFSGSSDRKVRPHLAGFLRYGRFTITGAGGFTTARQDNVERGLDAELVRREGVRINLALRVDQGRRESTSSQLTGMGDIRPTVRTRLGLRWEPAPKWGVSLAGSVDTLGRGGGYFVESGVSRTFTLDPRQRVILGANLAAGGNRYMQTWYGVTEQQSVASGYPVYKPGTGLRDVGASVTWRIDVNSEWAGFTSLGVTRLLGPAANSPLTRQPNSYLVAAGIARRF
jgi:MipA family protein